MHTLDEIYAKQDWWQQRYDNAHKRMRQAERTWATASQHLGVLPMVEQIAAALRPHFPNQTLAVLGPFGLGNTTSIHAYPIGLTEEQRRGNIGTHCVGSLTFRPRPIEGNYRLCLVDYNQNTGQYRPGSLGDYNGLNYAEVPMPSISALISMLWAEIKGKVA